MPARPTVAVILAAGLGKRMRSDLPKVLHPLLGRPMIDHALKAVEEAGIERIYVVTGHLGERVREVVGDRAICVDQPERLGTGHAVMQVEPHLEDFLGDVLVTYGDMPLVRGETYRRLMDCREPGAEACVMLSAVLDDPRAYGRIVRDAAGRFRKIVEERDCTPDQRAIREVNTGLYVFDAPLLFAALKQVGNANDQGEYYLTDAPAILLAEGRTINVIPAVDSVEILGVNSREQLAEVASHLRRRILSGLMDSGVTIVDPATTWVEPGVRVGRDTTIHPNTILRGTTVVGEGCVLGPGTELADADVGDAARVRHALVEGATIAPEAEVGPFTYLKR